MDQAVLFKGTVLAQSTVNHASDAGTKYLVVQRTGIMGLVEEGKDLVTGFELVDSRTDGFDCTGTI